MNSVASASGFRVFKADRPLPAKIGQSNFATFLNWTTV